MARQRTQPETSTYVCTSNHVEDLADGRTVEPGGLVTLDGPATAESHNAALINAGTLLLVNNDPSKED